MKKAISTFLMISFLTTNVIAQDKQIDIPSVETQVGEKDPGEAISPMKLNQRAPFTGVLLSPKAIAFLLSKLNFVDDRIRTAADESKDLAEEVCRTEKANLKIRTDADAAILQARIDDNQRILKMYENNTAKLEASQSDSVLMLGLGAVGGVIVTLSAALALSYAVK